MPTLIDIARQKGVSAFIGSGENLWSAVHVEDAAQLYVKALDSLAPGLTRFHAAADSGIAFRDIASAIGQGLGVPTQSIPQEAASEHFGWMGLFAGLGMSASSARTREKLDWHPTGPSLLEDLATGDYFDPARSGIS